MAMWNRIEIQERIISKLMQDAALLAIDIEGKSVPWIQAEIERRTGSNMKNKEEQAKAVKLELKDLKEADKTNVLVSIGEKVTQAFLNLGVGEFVCETDKSILSFKRKKCAAVKSKKKAKNKKKKSEFIERGAKVF